MGGEIILYVFILIVVLVIGFKRTSLIIAIFLALGLFVVGHISMTRVILARDDPRPVPELIDQYARAFEKVWAHRAQLAKI